MNVRLCLYRQEWTEAFLCESELLTRVLAPIPVVFEHFGSTSVPGMTAKPVIDVLGIVSDINIIDERTSVLMDLGYEPGGEWGISGRRLFRKGGMERTHHLHFYGEVNPEIQRHLIVRDYLRQSPEEVRRYSQYKEQLPHNIQIQENIAWPSVTSFRP